MDTTLEYLGYRANVTFDSTDNIYVGEVSGIKDSASFHGKTPDELNVDNHIAICKKAKE